MELIEREAAKALIEEKQKELCPVGKFSRNAVYGTDRDRFDAWDEIIDQIDALPTIDAAPVVHGRWDNDRTEEGRIIGYFCSVCGTSLDSHPRMRYCPNCGARMDEGVEDAD